MRKVKKYNDKYGNISPTKEERSQLKKKGDSDSFTSGAFLDDDEEEIAGDDPKDQVITHRETRDDEFEAIGEGYFLAYHSDEGVHVNARVQKDAGHLREDELIQRVPERTVPSAFVKLNNRVEKIVPHTASDSEMIEHLKAEIATLKKRIEKRYK
ncbi:hypothetical protein QAD02_021832 [Eretmocerus hayati]|uniref:Uncharacterized protein n=1 Tax=Eretmocerus hayati TaxID=131215 RepID=A0ACC2PRU0_9HYME|nr:hypothetical protein QAD02_021832 [Eretmocerus hayati]